MTTNFIDYKNPQNTLDKCETIMMDTCTVMKLASGDNDTVNFANFALNNDIMLCYSTKTIEELQIIQENIEFPKDKRTANLKLNWHLNRSYIKSDRIIKTVNSLPNMYEEPIEYDGNNFTNMAKDAALKHNLRWADSVIYTIAKSNEINFIWTHDSDWVNVKDADMTVITERRFFENNSNDSSNVINMSQANIVNK
ncbi:MAG: hypothetical protein ACRDA5_16405 [Clostridium sp.]